MKNIRWFIVIFVVLLSSTLTVLASDLPWPSEDEYGGVRALPTCDLATQVLVLENKENWTVDFAVRNDFYGTEESLVGVIPANSTKTVELPSYSKTNRIDFVTSDKHFIHRHTYMLEYDIQLIDCTSLVETSSLISAEDAGKSYFATWVNPHTGDEEFIEECAGIASPYGDTSCVVELPTNIIVSMYVDGVKRQTNVVDGATVCYSYAGPGMSPRENGSALPCS
jgi:hypothetical protein